MLVVILVLFVCRFFLFSFACLVFYFFGCAFFFFINTLLNIYFEMPFDVKINIHENVRTQSQEDR